MALLEKDFAGQRREIEGWPLVCQDRELYIAIRSSLAAGRMLRHGFYSEFETYVKKDRSEYTPFDIRAERLAASMVRRIYPDAQITGEELTPNYSSFEQAFWTFDGIDGTTNFSRGIPICNFNTSKNEKGKTRLGVVYDFLNGALYYAVRGMGAYKNGEIIQVSLRRFDEAVIAFAPLLDVREGKGEDEGALVEALWGGMREISERSGRFHREFQSGGLELAWVAEGRLDGYASSWTSPMDLSAGQLLVKEAGGKATNIFGESWRPGYYGVIAGNPHVHPQMLRIFQKHFKP